MADWVDFAFEPDPSRFAIYADHDEYTTFFADDEADLKLITSGLIDGGFRAIADWDRYF